MYCCLFPFLGSSHSKAKGKWESGCKGMKKKASFRSKTESQLLSLGIWARSVYRFVTSGWMGTVASLTNCKSCAVLYSPVGFITSRMGVFQGVSQGFISSCSRKPCILGCHPLFSSGCKGYCFLLGKGWVL